MEVVVQVSGHITHSKTSEWITQIWIMAHSLVTVSPQTFVVLHLAVHTKIDGSSFTWGSGRACHRTFQKVTKIA